MQKVDRFADLHVLPPGLEGFEAMLLNWARWVCTRRGRARPAPAFRSYVAPSVYERHAGAGVASDTVSALQVERAVAGMPEPFRGVLRAYYVHDHHPRRICTDHALHPSSLRQVLDDARRMARNRWRAANHTEAGERSWMR